MSRWMITAGAVLVIVAYVALVLLLGYDAVSPAINLVRVAAAIAASIIYVPVLTSIFRTEPAPRQDYLLLGIILTWTGIALSAIHNEIGAALGYDPSSMRNPISGLFAVMILGGAFLHVIAPGGFSAKRVGLAVAFGVAMAGLLFLLPN